MSKFDPYEYFHNALLKEQGEEDELDFGEDPGNTQAQQQTAQGQASSPEMDAPQAPEGGDQAQQDSPEAQTNQIEAGADHFASVAGQTIEQVEFERAQGNPNAGAVKIYTQKYQLPLIISWSNGRVTVTTPDSGEIYPLS